MTTLETPWKLHNLGHCLKWHKGCIVRGAESLYDLPIVADMLEEAGCEDQRLLEGCRACQLWAGTLIRQWPLPIMLADNGNILYMRIHRATIDKHQSLDYDDVMGIRTHKVRGPQYARMTVEPLEYSTMLDDSADQSGSRTSSIYLFDGAASLEGVAEFLGSRVTANRMILEYQFNGCLTTPRSW